MLVISKLDVETLACISQRGSHLSIKAIYKIGFSNKLVNSISVLYQLLASVRGFFIYW